MPIRTAMLHHQNIINVGCSCTWTCTYALISNSRSVSYCSSLRLPSRLHRLISSPVRTKDKDPSSSPRSCRC